MLGISRRDFHRNAAARDYLEMVLVSAVASLLLLRFYLYLTGYPQVGSGSLHIAHMLYGGLFMLAALVIQLSFIGTRVQKLCAVLGGAGFGIFIDELGKFITRDNNYFFRPTIGIIYAVFIGLYLLFNFISRDTKLSPREYNLNALIGMQEAVLHDMDNNEKRQVIQLLAQADQHDPLTIKLQELVSSITPIRNKPSRYNSWRTTMLRRYRHFWSLRGSSQFFSAIFIVQAIIFLIVIFGSIFANINSFRVSLPTAQNYGQDLLVGQLASSVIAAVFAIIGAATLPRARLRGFEWFRRATLVTIFLTEFFIFSRIQFGAMTGFIISLILLFALNFAITQESRARQ